MLETIGKPFFPISNGLYLIFNAVNLTVISHVLNDYDRKDVFSFGYGLLQIAVLLFGIYYFVETKDLTKEEIDKK